MGNFHQLEKEQYRGLLEQLQPDISGPFWRWHDGFGSLRHTVLQNRDSRRFSSKGRARCFQKTDNTIKKSNRQTVGGSMIPWLHDSTCSIYRQKRSTFMEVQSNIEQRQHKLSQRHKIRTPAFSNKIKPRKKRSGAGWRAGTSKRSQNYSRNGSTGYWCSHSIYLFKVRVRCGWQLKSNWTNWWTLTGSEVNEGVTHIKNIYYNDVVQYW